MSEAICSACQKPKAGVTARKSRIDPTVTLLLCDWCIAQKFEPRWMVIMAGRTYGPHKVKDFVKPKRYPGADILLEDMF